MSRVHISKSKRYYNVKFSANYFHICIGGPLKLACGWFSNTQKSPVVCVCVCVCVGGGGGGGES